MSIDELRAQLLVRRAKRNSYELHLQIEALVEDRVPPEAGLPFFRELMAKDVQRANDPAKPGFYGDYIGIGHALRYFALFPVEARSDLAPIVQLARLKLHKSPEVLGVWRSALELLLAWDESEAAAELYQGCRSEIALAQHGDALLEQFHTRVKRFKGGAALVKGQPRLEAAPKEAAAPPSSSFSEPERKLARETLLESVEFAPAESWSFRTVAPLTHARAHARVLLLEDGRILVAGGERYAEANQNDWTRREWKRVLPPPEVYSLDKNVWSDASELVGKDGRLRGVRGRVLGKKGWSSVDRIGGPDVERPIKAAFAGAGKTALESGGALTTGGFERFTAYGGEEDTRSTDRVEIVRATKRSPAGKLISARHAHGTALLEDGRVIVVGGQHDDDPGALASVELGLGPR